MRCLVGYNLARESVLTYLVGCPHQEAGLYITRKREGSARCQYGLRG